ncbi:beta-ketoacyl synthase chain length factor [Shewanella fidelis]|uniref:Beta-ketoacyl synthase chain length factor n=1 Tax=Shewanella fidelis TaxID=173509 RepID=A0AAW8NQW4_9GAMM|nr:beta-ketoacyl synthase chain length factor [Shewanella fidelis]MDR8525497.1 beta-ketoacyl synthase chain length factor [Shewanella fidelis]MDW4813184.1 beta-ketoacyl synthase chain length factor [Shewanella fidelis]MDW4816936.1 beta-ketoacyl synthase chain length factor [Shewanella fidelis]MDW4820095.1 beta-ketoacyl synthase chain length factor [Shewanella fidelis]MDW4825649.1 beta-ketoacyl synthase chain length factor [Shewanella fidelis]
MHLKFSILSWGAWSPQYQQAADWLHWQSEATEDAAPSSVAPKLAHVPAMQRRRLSKLTKIVLEAVHQCAPKPQCRSIFASQHGEINRTIDLLNNIVEGEALSPTGFSQSVHNTASGIFSIFNGNRAASTSIAAGSNTFSQAFIEAYAQLHSNPEPLLLVYADEPVPQVYSQFASQPEWPIAIAFVLAPADINQDKVATLKLSAQPQADADATELHYGQLLACLAANKPLTGRLSGWHWELNCD